MPNLITTKGTKVLEYKSLIHFYKNTYLIGKSLIFKKAYVFFSTAFMIVIPQSLLCLL